MIYNSQTGTYSYYQFFALKMQLKLAPTLALALALTPTSLATVWIGTDDVGGEWGRCSELPRLHAAL